MIRNSGIITDSHTELDINVYEHFRHGKTALVTQGGGQRGIFTAGVLDAFLLSILIPSMNSMVLPLAHLTCVPIYVVSMVWVRLLLLN